MGIPIALASLERATAHPSLFESTITGRFSKEGRKTRSQET